MKKPTGWFLIYNVNKDKIQASNKEQKAETIQSSEAVVKSAHTTIAPGHEANPTHYFIKFIKGFKSKQKHNNSKGVKSAAYEFYFSKIAEKICPHSVPSLIPVLDNKENKLSALAPLGIGYICNQNGTQPAPNIFLENYLKPSKTDKDKNPSYFFLSKLNNSFFENLITEKENTIEALITSKITMKDFFKVDYESLAEVLTGSYLLEEDDLHKENIGIYFVKGDDGKSIIKFFKIDHDLMFLDSIMSYQGGARPEKKFAFKRNFFTIQAEDLLNFPNVKSTDAHHTVDRNRLLKQNLGGTQKKSYTSNENNAFKSLKNNKAFQKEKWKHFIRQATLSEKEIKNALYDEIFQNKLCHEQQAIFEQARNDTLRATLNRQRMLKINMLLLKDHWEKIKLDGNEKKSLEDLNKLEKKEGDNSLHIAIRNDLLSAYDLSKKGNRHHYKQKKESFSNLINKKNTDKETPLDVLLTKLIEKKRTGKLMTENDYILFIALIKRNASTSKSIEMLNDPLLKKFLKINSFNIRNVTDIKVKHLLKDLVEHDPQYLNVNFIYAMLVHYGKNKDISNKLINFISNNPKSHKALIEKITKKPFYLRENLTLAQLEKKMNAVAKNPKLDINATQNVLIALYGLLSHNLNSDVKEKFLDNLKTASKEKYCYNILRKNLSSNWIIRSLNRPNKKTNHVIKNVAIHSEKNDSAQIEKGFALLHKEFSPTHNPAQLQKELDYPQKKSIKPKNDFSYSQRFFMKKENSKLIALSKSLNNLKKTYPKIDCHLNYNDQSQSLVLILKKTDQINKSPYKFKISKDLIILHNLHASDPKFELLIKICHELHQSKFQTSSVRILDGSEGKSTSLSDELQNKVSQVYSKLDLKHANVLFDEPSPRTENKVIPPQEETPGPHLF